MKGPHAKKIDSEYVRKGTVSISHHLYHLQTLVTRDGVIYLGRLKMNPLYIGDCMGGLIRQYVMTSDLQFRGFTCIL